MQGGTHGHAFNERAEARSVDAQQVGVGSTENSADPNRTGADGRGDLDWNSTASKQLFGDRRNERLLPARQQGTSHS
jgi:hypothetical protein